MIRHLIRHHLWLISVLAVLVGLGWQWRNQGSPDQAEAGFRQLTQADSAIWHDIRIGTASWYGPVLHGRPTANGERFDQTALTAAYMVPFGTNLKITNLKNNKSVIVRVNDRHPAQDQALIDISKAAAQKIDSIQAGLVPVKIEVLPLSTPPDPADHPANPNPSARGSDPTTRTSP